jgi:integrase
MKRHLTDAAIQRIKPPKEGTTEVFDLGYPGLALRVGHGGSKSFEQFYRSGGKLKRESLGRWPSISLAEARERWRKTREALAKGEAPSRREGIKDSTRLFERVIEEWIKRDQSDNKQSSQYQVVRTVERDLLPAWRGKRVDEITKPDVIELIDSIVDRGAPVKARQTFTHINRFFRWCVERDILQTSPMASMKRPTKGKSRERVLTDAELGKVWKGADRIGPLGIATRLLILTGARREEITQLRWSEIDGNTITLSNGRTKNGEAHIIPLSAQARKLLDSMPRIGNSDFVFTNDGVKPIVAWAKPKSDLDDVSGVTDWRIHDLRRTVATGMQKLGIPLVVTESILGHVSGSRAGIVGVYQRHDYAQEKSAALQAWGAHVVAIVC